MATLTEDDVLEQLDAQDNLFSFMKTAHSILLQGIRQFLPSLFVDNDEEIVEYAVKPLLAQSGPLDDIDVALRLIYALGKMDKWLYADITHFSQFWHYLNEQDETPGFADDITWDFISNVNSIIRNASLYDALKAMKFADFVSIFVHFPNKQEPVCGRYICLKSAECVLPDSRKILPLHSRFADAFASGFFLHKKTICRIWYYSNSLSTTRMVLNIKFKKPPNK